jgi:diamine N-acetyltransferase
MNEQAAVTDVVAKIGERIAEAPQLSEFNTVIQLKLTGETGGDWFFDCTTHPRRIQAGTVADPVCTLIMDVTDFLALISGKLEASIAHQQGKLQVEGNSFIARTIIRLIIEPPARTAVVSLREITAETVNAVLDLKVAPAQETFVAANAVSIAQAHFTPEAWFRAVYANEIPVGFLLLYDDPKEPTYFLWRFMIDARYQGLGFGQQAIKQLVEYVKTRPSATELGVSCVPGEGSPCPFYEKLGFQATGKVNHGEVELRLPLS